MTTKKTWASLIITLSLICLPYAQVAGLDTAVLVDRSHSIQPLGYTPPVLTVPQVLLTTSPNDPEMQLVPQAASHLTALFKHASHDNIELVLSSGYRPYEEQAVLYAGNSAVGNTNNEFVAMPGYSEHQTGLAADVITDDYLCAAQDCFAMTKAAAWLSQNAYRYGFIVRYPLYKEFSTGYTYEPWHLRYVGKSLATRLYHSGQTLEEYYGLP